MNYEIISSIHSVYEALKAKRRTFFEIYISNDKSSSRADEIIEIAELYKINIKFISSDALDLINKGVKHQGVSAKVTQFPIKKAETEISNLKASNNKEPAGTNKKLINPNKELNSSKEDFMGKSKAKFIVVLEGIEDTHNLGAIIRTALCAGADHIVIPKDRAVQPSPAVSRVSAGAMEHADIWIATNTVSALKNLKKNGFWIAGLDAEGTTSLFNADLTDNIALVVGGEHQGIRQLVKKECDFLLSLPLLNEVTSLNASVACGIAMYEVVRQRQFFIRPPAKLNF